MMDEDAANGELFKTTSVKEFKPYWNDEQGLLVVLNKYLLLEKPQS
jgi:hypothetical protein